MASPPLVQLNRQRPIRPIERKPSWLKVPAPGGPNYLALKHLMRDLKLHTVCEEAHCPNIGECWEHRAATFMILGDVCTRNCAYCAVAHGTPAPLDTDEPARLGAAVEQMELRHVVITSVDRDDLPNGGAEMFAAAIAEIRRGRPGTPDELLVAMRDLRAQDVDILTIGQYLRPSSQHLPIARYYTPDEFAALRRHGLEMGYRHVEAGPLVRSSYHAWEQVARATATR